MLDFIFFKNQNRIYISDNYRHKRIQTILYKSGLYKDRVIFISDTGLPFVDFMPCFSYILSNVLNNDKHV